MAQATTATFNPALSSRTVVNSSAATVGTSSLAWEGNFNSEAFTFNPLLSISENVTAITTAGGWKRFGLDTATGATDSGVTLPGLTISSAGKLGGPISDNNFGATKADYFNNKSLYIWIFNATTVAAATEMGIFRSTDASVPWTFAINSGGFVDAATYTTAATGAPTMLAISGVGTVQPVGGSFTNGALQLAASVPEPSVLSLVGLAGLAMLFSRRRNQRKQAPHPGDWARFRF